ncbi:hypothetical protein ACOBR2_10455 [Telmatobacter bradus]|uniref:hypothetical protein n=1 Tax=Telmatobacter bradus TaxID=474953 RepID=UPI003B42F0B1
MTTVDLVFRLAAAPTESAAVALSRTRDVYGIRCVALDASNLLLTVEYDATRLNSATVANLVRRAGVQISEVVEPVTPSSAAPAAA